MIISDKHAKAFWSRVRVSGADECWEWTGATAGKGYGMAYAGRSLRAHRLAWALANGESVETPNVVMHTCDNPRCCNPRHLRAGTHLENMRDMREKGRSARMCGADNSATKFSDTVVAAALSLRDLGVAQRAIAKILGISKTYAHQLCKGTRRVSSGPTRFMRRNWPR